MSIRLLDVLNRKNKAWFLRVLASPPLDHLAAELPNAVSDNEWKYGLSELLRRHGLEDMFAGQCMKLLHQEQAEIVRRYQETELELCELVRLRDELVRQRDELESLSRTFYELAGPEAASSAGGGEESDADVLPEETEIRKQLPWPDPIALAVARCVLQSNNYDIALAQELIEAYRRQNSQGLQQGPLRLLPAIFAWLRRYPLPSVPPLAGPATDLEVARTIVMLMAADRKVFTTRQLSERLGQAEELIQEIVDYFLTMELLEARAGGYRLREACATCLLVALPEAERDACFVRAAAHLPRRDIRRIERLAAGRAWDLLVEEALEAADAFRRDGCLENSKLCLEYARDALNGLEHEPSSMSARDRANWRLQLADTLLRLLVHERSGSMARLARSILESLNMEETVLHNLLCIVRSYEVDSQGRQEQALELLGELMVPMFSAAPMLEVSRLLSAGSLGQRLGRDAGFMEGIARELEDVARRCEENSPEWRRAYCQALNCWSVIENQRRNYQHALKLALKAARLAEESEEIIEKSNRLLNAAGYALGLSRLDIVAARAREVEAEASRHRLFTYWARAQLLLLEVAYREGQKVSLQQAEDLFQVCKYLDLKEWAPIANFALARLEWTIVRGQDKNHPDARTARRQLRMRASKLANHRSLVPSDLLIRAMAVHGTGEHDECCRLIEDAREALGGARKPDPEILIQIVAAVLDGQRNPPRDWIELLRHLLDDPSIQYWNPTQRRELFSLEEVQAVLRHHGTTSSSLQERIS